MTTIRPNFTMPLASIKKANEEQMDQTMEKRGENMFRPLCVKCGVFMETDGSGYAEFGKTRVLATINGPRSEDNWEKDYAKITVTMKGLEDSLMAQCRAQLHSTLTAVILADKYPGKAIDIEVTVLSNDGGVLALSLVAASLALAHSGIENLGLISAAHVGLKSDGGFVTDPSTQESTTLIGGATLACLTNLNQIPCFDVYGCIPYKEVSRLMTFAKDRAIGLVPTLHRAAINSIKKEIKDN